MHGNLEYDIAPQADNILVLHTLVLVVVLGTLADDELVFVEADGSLE